MKLILLITIATIAFVAMLLLREPDGPAATPTTPSAPSPDNAFPGGAEPVAPSAAPSKAGPASLPERMSTADYLQLFDDSTDMLQLAERLHPRARQGDAAAQYFLWSALRQCFVYYDDRFVVSEGGRTRELGLDEALKKQGSSATEAEEMTSAHRACQRLRAAGVSKFGTVDEWFEAALEQDYPLAQVVRARTHIPLYRNSDNAEDRRKYEEAKQMGIAALRDGDPEVLLRASEYAFTLAAYEKDPTDGTRARRVFVIAACLRGANCGPRAKWVRQACREDPACHPLDGALDLMRRELGEGFAELERLATALNSRIDSKNWEGFDLSEEYAER